MITQQLLDYIAQEIQGGSSPDTIKAALRSNGWIETDIEQAFATQAPTPQSITPQVQIVEPTKTEYFIPSKKKSSTLKVILIVIGVLVAGGVAYAAYVFTAQPTLTTSSPAATTTNPVPEALPIAPPAPEIPLDIATTTPSGTFATSTASTTPIASQDCGSVIGIHFFYQSGVPNPMTAQEKASTACISKAFINCDPATFAIQGTGGASGGSGSYEINGKINSYCSIVQKTTNPPGTNTCKVPMNLISGMALSTKSQSEADLIFLPVPFILMGSGGKLIDPKTGQKIVIECTK